LGDYNTLIDKLQTNAGLEDFERDIAELQKKNSTYSASLDEMFLKRKDEELQIKQTEEKIAEQQHKADLLIKTLVSGPFYPKDPAKQKIFGSMKQENRDCMTAMEEIQSKLEHFSKEYTVLQKKVNNDPVKKKAALLSHRLMQVKDKKSELELAIQKSRLESETQERKRLLEQVKNDNLEINAMGESVIEYEEKLSELKKELRDKETDPAQVEKQAKFDELVKREKEMHEFMDGFSTKRNEILDQSLSTETEITDLLMSIRNLSQRNNAIMPSKENFKDVKNTLTMKSKDLKNSANTVDALVHGI
jgi:intraflagellar transport protein 74